MDMTFRNNLIKAIAVLSVGTVAIAPLSMNSNVAQAQTREQKNRQKHKNDWRNLSIGSGAIALLGLLKGDTTVTFLGAAGSLYSAYRYEQDRKSQSKQDRARAALFSKSSFTRDGQRYVRKTKWVKGKKYYYFAKAR